MAESKTTQLDLLKRRIPYDETINETYESYIKMLEDILEDSKNVAFEILYPYEEYPEELPSRYHNWQLRACVELYNLADKAGITNYSENGISWSKLNDGLSVSLLTALTSKVGIPKKEEDGE